MPDNEENPGVTSERTPHPARPIEGIDTSVTVLVGRSRRGALLTPILCNSISDFNDTFSATNPLGDLSRAVRLFFANGGSSCHVVRVTNRDDPEAAPRPGDYRDALDAVAIELAGFNLLVLPCDHAVDTADLRETYRLASHFCRDRRGMLLLDAPSEWAGLVDVRDTWSDLGIARMREGLALESCAMFYPRVLVREEGSEVPTGSSGAIAGLMASYDVAHGVWTPAAGLDAIIVDITGLERDTTEEDSSLFANEGVAVLRTVPKGVVSWGACTMAGHTGSWWKFIPVRRLALYIEQSVKRGTEWVASEPNDPLLWVSVQESVGAFLDDLWKQGALEGSKPEEAYFVRCDDGTTTEEDVEQDRVRFHVGFAPIRPDELMVLEFSQRAGKP